MKYSLSVSESANEAIVIFGWYEEKLIGFGDWHQ